MTKVEENSDCYGIVIDAGSSGSRIHVYRWTNPNSFDLTNTDPKLKSTLHSVPDIHQEENWTYKVSPGLSSYEHKTKKAFSEHINPLLHFAKDIIPTEKIKDTPVFVQATAGMRLLPEKKRKEILTNVCNGLSKDTDFLINDCASQIQVIDGETEGLFGWLTLNYLSGMLNNYDASKKDHFTLGFLDMGGASTQIAFSPSDQTEVSKHDEDIATIYLKSVNGDVQKWNVFVSTWLGFGANQARSRYFAQLINVLPENTNKYDDDDFSTRTLSDPCLQKGYSTIYNFKGRDFTIEGSGDYEKCTKLIYPLLLTNMPCIDEPCLFNGVHSPQVDYARDKFVGTSEFWYTANDIFKLGGTYNFKEYNEKVKEFCNTDWAVIKKNSDAGLYNNIPDNFIAASCFKANWILNVLHEGFNLPRIDAEPHISDDIRRNHPLFQSAANVNGMELSWTLGRILLFASGSILNGRQSIKVGIEPSPIRVLKHGKKFLAGNLTQIVKYNSNSWVLKYLFILMFLLFLFIFNRNPKLLSVLLISIQRTSLEYSQSHPTFSSLVNKIGRTFSTINTKFRSLKYNRAQDRLVRLEEGIVMNNQKDKNKYPLKSKSTPNLEERMDNFQSRRNMGGALFSTTASIRSGPPSVSSINPNNHKHSETIFPMTDFSKISRNTYSS